MSLFVPLDPPATTQMESALPRCQECEGSGEIVLRGCHHVGNCPCGEDKAFPCAACDGTGRGPCHCGEPATRLDYWNREPICATCGIGEDDEPGDDYLLREYDRPAEYRQQMEEARRLK